MPFLTACHMVEATVTLSNLNICFRSGPVVQGEVKWTCRYSLILLRPV